MLAVRRCREVGVVTLSVYGSRVQAGGSPRHHILVVARTDAFARSLVAVLARVPDFHVSVVGDPAVAARRLTTGGIDAVVLDLRGDEIHALVVVQQSLRRVPLVPVVVLAAASHVDLLTEVLRCGATDVLIDGEFDDSRLELALRHALECRRQHEQLARVRADARVDAMRRSIAPSSTDDASLDPWQAIQARARLAIARIDHAIDAETKLRALLRPYARRSASTDELVDGEGSLFTLADEMLDAIGRDLDAARLDAAQLAELAATAPGGPRRPVAPS